MTPEQQARTIPFDARVKMLREAGITPAAIAKHCCVPIEAVEASIARIESRSEEKSAP